MAHDWKPTEGQTARLQQFEKAVEAAQGDLTAELLRSADRILGDFSADDLAHVSGTWEQQKSATRLTAIRCLGALRHLRGWGRELRDGAAIVADVASGSPSRVARSLSPLLSEINHPALLRALEALVSEREPDTRVLVGRMLPSVRYLRVSALNEAAWIRGTAHRLATDEDPMVTANVAFHLAELQDVSVTRSLCSRLESMAATPRAEEGLLSMSQATLGVSIQTALSGFLRFSLADIPRPLAAGRAQDLLEWSRALTDAADLRLDERKWSRFASRQVVLEPREKAWVRDETPGLAVQVDQVSFKDKPASVSCSVKLLDGSGVEILAFEIVDCPLGMAAYRTLSVDDSSPGHAAWGGEWKVHLRVTPAAEKRVRMLVEVWRSRRS